MARFSGGELHETDATAVRIECGGLRELDLRSENFRFRLERRDLSFRRFDLLRRLQPALEIGLLKDERAQPLCFGGYRRGLDIEPDRPSVRELNDFG